MKNVNDSEQLSSSAEGSSSGAEGSSSSGSTISARSKILIVDDSATIRATLTRAVEQEFPCLDATTGEEAWRLIESNDNIKLVITDLNMPELDGFGLVKRMRDSNVDRIKAMPVIMLTAENDTASREKAFAAGANDFITKTSDHVEFLARVRSHEKLARTIQELEESRRYLKEQANTDPLTKLANRRSFFDLTTMLLAQMHRQKEHFSVAMIDIDHFKPINDTYGHHAGDYVLTQMAGVLTSVIREGDILARLGGEEFAIASPYTNRLAAIVLSERLRKAVEQSIFVFEGNQIPVTISIGVASLTEEDDDIDRILAVADSRLYIAKQKGRNRICAADKSDGPDKMQDLDMICPRLEEAMTMIKHGNTFRLMPHLHELAEQLIPFLELINEEQVEPKIDIEAFKKTIAALDR